MEVEEYKPLLDKIVESSTNAAVEATKLSAKFDLTDLRLKRLEDAGECTIGQMKEFHKTMDGIKDGVAAFKIKMLLWMLGISGSIIVSILVLMATKVIHV